MSIAVYPGSFDPVTYGHIDIIERSAKVFDKLIIAVLVNSAKKPMFTTQEKVDMIRKVTSHLDNVEVMSFSGLLVDFAKQQGASVSVRGLILDCRFCNTLPKRSESVLAVSPTT